MIVNPSIIIPQVITQDLFPTVYAFEVPTMNVNDMYSEYYDTLNFGLPRTITQYVDPAVNVSTITGPQKYEHKYVNSNGVDVVIRGTYNDVMATVDVLNAYPPIKKNCSNSDANANTNKKQYFELYGPGSGPEPTTMLPKSVGVTSASTLNDVNHINIKMDGKIYSGSGSLIMVAEQGKPMTDAKFILFRDTNGFFQDLGGKIDKPSSNTPINKDILFNNAKKETAEESMKLFNITCESTIYVDVESTIDNTFYRVYLYLFVMNNINQLASLYDANRMQILTNFPHNYNESYKETNMLDLFDYNTFMNKLPTYNPMLYNTSSGVFQTVSGQQVNVRGRTIKVIAKLQSENKFLELINNNKITKSSLVTAANTATNTSTNTTLFNTITL